MNVLENQKLDTLLGFIPDCDGTSDFVRQAEHRR